MSRKRSVCVVTGGRADYGLLQPVMRAISQSPSLALQVVATGMHLSPEFGLTYRAIEGDGFAIDARVEMLLSADTPSGIAKSMGLGTIGFGEVFERLKPDLLMLLGDRFEILAAAQAALVARLPIAHISGGDTTVGAMDEAMRHAITKMAHLHFVTNEPARRRVHQLGEDPRTVFLVGNPALDLALRAKLLERTAVERALGFAFRRHNLLVTFHSATLDEHPSAEPMAALLAALEALGSDVGIVFTLPNADPFGRTIIAMIEGYVATHPGAMVHASLGQLLYWSTVAQVDAVVGNSSSGLLEVPSFGKPTVNIGDRQSGRLRAPSVVDCAAERDAILGAIRQAFALDCRAVVNPYGDGNAAPRIVEVLERTPDYGALIKKRFFDLEAAP